MKGMRLGGFREAIIRFVVFLYDRELCGWVSFVTVSNEFCVTLN
jgi:hypothetical protein